MDQTGARPVLGEEVQPCMHHHGGPHLAIMCNTEVPHVGSGCGRCSLTGPGGCIITYGDEHDDARA